MTRLAQSFRHVITEPIVADLLGCLNIMRVVPTITDATWKGHNYALNEQPFLRLLHFL
jgi:hypothetical protein